MQNYNNLKVDLSNCDKEPIHIIGRIQPHGFMIILDQKTLQIEQVSSNLSAFLEVKPEEMLGQSLEGLCSGEGYLLLERQLRNSVQLNPKLLLMQGKLFFGFIHESSGKLVLECEPLVPSADQQRLENTYLFSQVQSELNNLDSLAAQSQLVVDRVQSILDYD
ncbi:MAG: hypothetical protein LPK03_08025, partial [Pontibacter sp.]|nr:hypothetical protein [Pontibacter sp.]